MNKELQFLVYLSIDEDVNEAVVVSKMEKTTAHAAMPEKTQKKGRILKLMQKEGDSDRQACGGQVCENV